MRFAMSCFNRPGEAGRFPPPGSSGGRRACALAGATILALAVAAPAQVTLDAPDALPARSRPVPTVTPIHVQAVPLDQVKRIDPATFWQLKEECKKAQCQPNPKRKRAPIAPGARPDLVPVRSLPTEPQQPAAPGLRAPGDLLIFSNHVFDDTETNDQVSESACEPSVGMNGRILWASGNWFGGVSADYNQNFAFVDPATNFPSIVGGFCCDQVVQYDRLHNMMLWYLQYSDDATGSNAVRLAVSVGQPNQENNVWHLYDITPGLFGYAAGVSFDFPGMALGTNELYITTNLVGHSDNAICIRLDLDALRAAGTVSLYNTVSSLPNLRACQGAGTTQFIGTQVDTNTLRIFRWPEADSSATSVDRDVDAWFTGSSAPDPDGNDWISRDFNDILAAYVSGSNMVFMWDSAQGGAFPNPNVRIARFRTSDRALVDQGVIWSPSMAWAYPDMYPNDRGHVGGTMAFGGKTGGGATTYPSMAVAIADDYGGSQTGPMDALSAALGNLGTPNRWGDYYTARRASPYANTWIAAGYVLRTEEPGSNTQPHIVWFGRERDQPPASNTIYADWAYTNTWETGTITHPYGTLFEAHYAAVAGDTLRLDTGTYNEGPLVLDKDVDVIADGGTVTIE